LIAMAMAINALARRGRTSAMPPCGFANSDSCRGGGWRTKPAMSAHGAMPRACTIETVPMARIDCWGGEPPPYIICEARATRGVLERITSEYLPLITATGGQCGGHIVNKIVPLLRHNERKVLYIGDCEERGPGDQIEANTRRYIEDHAGRIFTPETWIKVALTPQHGQPTPGPPAAAPPQL